MLAGTILHSFGCMAAAGWPQNAQRRFLFFAKGVITDVQRQSFLCWRRRKTVEKMTVTSNDSKLQFTSNFFVKWIFSKKIYFVDSTIWLWKDVIVYYLINYLLKSAWTTMAPSRLNSATNCMNNFFIKFNKVFLSAGSYNWALVDLSQR